MKKGLLIVLSGPSGSGKSTVNEAVRELLPNLKKSVSVTTRAPRTGETEGIHYYFKSVEQYRQMIADGQFLETAEVFTNYYGTPKAKVFELLENGNDVILEIDTIGAMQVKAQFPESVLVFIVPPTLEELERRLRGRNTESEDAQNLRLRAAKREMSKMPEYQYVIENNDPMTAARTLAAIITSEHCAVRRNHKLIASLTK